MFCGIEDGTVAGWVEIRIGLVGVGGCDVVCYSSWLWLSFWLWLCV